MLHAEDVKRYFLATKRRTAFPWGDKQWVLELQPPCSATTKDGSQSESWMFTNMPVEWVTRSNGKHHRICLGTGTVSSGSAPTFQYINFVEERSQHDWLTVCNFITLCHLSVLTLTEPKKWGASFSGYYLEPFLSILRTFKSDSRFPPLISSILVLPPPATWTGNLRIRW